MQQLEPRIIVEPPVLLDETSTHPSYSHRSTASLASSRPLSGFVYQLFSACGPAFSPSINLSSSSSLRLLQGKVSSVSKKKNSVQAAHFRLPTPSVINRKKEKTPVGICTSSLTNEPVNGLHAHRKANTF